MKNDIGIGSFEREGRPVKELEDEGFKCQGVLRRNPEDTDQQFAMRRKRFDDAIEQAKKDGKTIEIIKHEDGEDFWVK